MRKDFFFFSQCKESNRSKTSVVVDFSPILIKHICLFEGRRRHLIKLFPVEEYSNHWKSNGSKGKINKAKAKFGNELSHCSLSLYPYHKLYIEGCINNLIFLYYFLNY